MAYQNLLLEVAMRTIPGSAPPWRPIQYLGSKLRSLPEIMDAICLLGPQGAVMDLFSGSTVVAQAVASAGLKAVAVDVAGYSNVFGKALLGVGKARGDDLRSLLECLEIAVAADAPDSPYHGWAEEEQSYIRSHDAIGLIELSNTIPQRWRKVSSVAPLASAKPPPADNLSNAIVQTHYAGTYFGVRQAIEIDVARVTIERWFRDGQTSEWQHAALLTCLLHACSRSVFSAGKHFAQPHKISAGKSTVFIKSRILSDRRINVIEEMRVACTHVEEGTRGGDEGHIALHSSMEDLLAADRDLPDVSVIYADPPYTAQQYSRFYHVLEVILAYERPVLQRWRGAITTGLYPENRFKSRFCSRRHAPGAFRDLCRLASQQGADLLISYSASKGRSTGNARMISLEDLCEVVASSLPDWTIRLLELGHSYRQFNTSSASDAAADDREYLVLVERPC